MLHHGPSGGLTPPFDRPPRAARSRLRRVRGTLDVNGKGGFRRDRGTVRPGRLGVWYRHRWTWPRYVVWNDISDWSVGPDRTWGMQRHTHALVVRWIDGSLALRVRGPWGAVALVRFRDAASAHSSRGGTTAGLLERSTIEAL